MRVLSAAISFSVRPNSVPSDLEIALVLDPLLLDVFQRHRPALLVVALEFGLGLDTVPDLDEA